MAKKRISKKLRLSIKRYIDALRADNLSVERVFLFGSYAKGSQNRWSDLDICVISPDFKNSWEATQYLWSKLPFRISPTIEPIGFNPQDFRADSTLISQIKKTGIRII